MDSCIVLYYLQERAEDADVLIMLIHHSSSTSQPLFFTASKGSFNVRRIQESLSAIRFSMFSRKAAAGTIKPKALPPIGGAAGHNLQA